MLFVSELGAKPPQVMGKTGTHDAAALGYRVIEQTPLYFVFLLLLEGCLNTVFSEIDSNTKFKVKDRVILLELP